MNAAPSKDDDKSWINDLFPDPIDVLPALYGQLHGRGDDTAFLTSASWFGGAPKLGTLAWPRCAANLPMTHVATIDLAETARLSGALPLPSDGQLAFFLPMSDVRQEIGVKVLHVTQPGPTAMPDDLPEISRMAGGGFEAPLPRHEDLRFLRRYPVKFTPTRPTEPKPFDMPRAALMSANSLAGCLPNQADPWLWDSLQRFAMTLPRSASDFDEAYARAEKDVARAQTSFEAAERKHAEDPSTTTADIVEKYRKALEKHQAASQALLDRREDYAAMVQAFQALVQDKDPWDALPDAALAQAHEVFDSITRPFGQNAGGIYAPLYRSGEGTRYRRLSDTTTQTLTAMVHAAPEIFRKLPEPVQRLAILQADSAQRTASLQMFGTGYAIQDANELNADKHMLMQFCGAGHLGLAEGAIKVWISPEDLTAGRFDQAQVSYEYD